MKRIAPLFVIFAIALGLVPLIHFAVEQGGVVWPDAYAWRVTRFTLLQAALSTMLSVIPAIAVARALARQQFRGRALMLALFAVPLALPVIVAIFGLTALYGTSGILGGLFPLYGLGGIVVAHVFFNLPLSTRLVLAALEAVPPESHRLAAQLDFSAADIFRHVDWPALKPALPRIAALVFLLCASSFVIVLVLGGVAATTLEVAIYQSLRMDFDVTRALTLSFIQLLLSAVLVFLSAQAMQAPEQMMALRLQSQRLDGRNPVARLADGMIIGAALALILPVLVAIVVQGLLHIDLNATFAEACVTSIAIASCSTLVAMPLAWGMGQAQAAKWRGLASALGFSAYLVPPAVLATGWFLAFRNLDMGRALPIMLIAAMNALMALPFILTVLAPAMTRNSLQHDRLCGQLGLSGFNRLWVVDLPSLRGPLVQALLMAFVLSLGDLTAVTLLGSQGLITLPNLVQQQMGHYQSQAAGGTALVLAGLCLALTLAAQRMAQWK